MPLCPARGKFWGGGYSVGLGWEQSLERDTAEEVEAACCLQGGQGVSRAGALGHGLLRGLSYILV